jgi:hypothetical protein
MPASRSSPPSPAWSWSPPVLPALIETRGARFTLLTGYVFCVLGFTTMLQLWDEGSAYWQVGLGYLFVGIGVGFAGTPASHSLTGSVPVTRAGMASGTADPQRDLGGAIMQSIFGALLTAGYASAISASIAASPDQDKITDGVQSELTKSFASASATAEQYPQYSAPDHVCRAGGLPAGRRLGVLGRAGRDPARRDPGLLLLPDEGRGRGAAGGLPDGGQQRTRQRLASGLASTSSSSWSAASRSVRSNR